MIWYVYILRGRSGSLYTGVTTDIVRRIYEHNHVKSKASRHCWGNKPMTLECKITCRDKCTALYLERKIKSWSKETKEQFLVRLTPDVLELHQDEI